ncbi:hypothetical protein P3S68_001049 [Capsicum galapagoense]
MPSLASLSTMDNLVNKANQSIKDRLGCILWFSTIPFQDTLGICQSIALYIFLMSNFEFCMHAVNLTNRSAGALDIIFNGNSLAGEKFYRKTIHFRCFVPWHTLQSLQNLLVSDFLDEL